MSMIRKDNYGFTKDFIKRTITNYKSLMYSDNKTKYDVTLLINSAIGVFIVPKEKVKDKIKDELIDDDLMEILQNSISDESYGDDQYDLFTIVRHIRNSIAHGNLSFYSDDKNDDMRHVSEIKYIEFYDFATDKRDNIIEEFWMTLTVEEFRLFFEQFADRITRVL